MKQLEFDFVKDLSSTKIGISDEEREALDHVYAWIGEDDPSANYGRSMVSTDERVEEYFNSIYPSKVKEVLKFAKEVYEEEWNVQDSHGDAYLTCASPVVYGLAHILRYGVENNVFSTSELTQELEGWGVTSHSPFQHLEANSKKKPNL